MDSLRRNVSLNFNLKGQPITTTYPKIVLKISIFALVIVCPLLINFHRPQHLNPLSFLIKGSVGLLAVSIGSKDTMYIERPLDIIQNCGWCPLFNGLRGHTVSIQLTQWTYSMDTISDVKFVKVSSKSTAEWVSEKNTRIFSQNASPTIKAPIPKIGC